MAGKDVKETKDINKFKEGIGHTNECNEKILSFLEKESDHITSVRDTLSSLNRILVKPV